MNSDFSKPQRQSAVGIIIMAANTLQHAIRVVIFPLVIAVVKADREFLAYLGIGSLVLLALVLIFSYLSYKRFTFYLDEHKQEFVVNKGIFNKTQLTVQLDKIQQVNINQNLLQKIIGIYGLKIDTAGSDGQEVSIKAIDEDLATSLRAHLLSRQSLSVHQEYRAEQRSSTANVPFLNVGAATLFKVGLTSNYGSSLALLVGFSYAVFHNVKEFLKALDNDNGQIEAAIQKGFTLASVGILVAALLVILLLINIVRTFVKYFDFQISRHEHSLLISSGLLAKKNILLKPTKVQVTVYSQNYFQKKLNLITMNLKQADGGKEENGKAHRKANLEIPGCSSLEKDEILRLILGQVPLKSTVFKPNFRFLNLPIIFKIILPVGIFFSLWNVFPQIHPYYPLTIFYALISVVMIYISYRRHRLYVDQDFIVKKSGIWDISHEIVLPHKIQAITTFQYPWHKGLDIGHVNLHTAAEVIHFKYGNYTEIKKLVNYWLYQIESGSEEWM